LIEEEEIIEDADEDHREDALEDELKRF